MLRHVNFFGESRMDIHKNARTTPHSRGEIVRRVIVEGQTPGMVAAAFGVCVKTVSKWVERFREAGPEALVDRSSRPHRLHKPTPGAVRENVISLRRMRRPGTEIARETGLSPSTISRILRAVRLSRARDLDPPPPARRYEHEHPGDMIHVDIKKLGRFERIGHRITGDRTGQSSPRSRGKGYGWEFVHVCIDDHSRVSFSQIHPNEKAPAAVAHLKASVAYYQSLGVTVRRVLSDNGACYKSHAFRDACRELGVKHVRTRPYTPRTNGKAERFIQTALREWAYARAYDTSDQRAQALPAWTHRYNWHRPHGGIKAQTPISRLGLSGDNLLRVHI
jgi:transposase InsO family protein